MMMEMVELRIAALRIFIFEKLLGGTVSSKQADLGILILMC